MRNSTRSVFAAALVAALLVPSSFAQAIAQIKAAEGQVEIMRDGTWRRGREGTELTLKDSIRTGPDALAQIEFYDGGEGLTPTTIDLVPETEISISHFEISKTLPRKRQGLVEMAKGYLRAFTKGWSSGSVFSVKAGTTVCGIRGSVAAVRYDPGSGTATVQAASGEIFTFQADNLFDAISGGLTFASQMAAGMGTPPGVTQLPPGTQFDKTPTTGGTVVTLGPKTQQKLNDVVTPLKKAIKALSSGPPSPQKLNTAIKKIGDVNEVIQAITQEIIQARELNKVISTQ